MFASINTKAAFHYAAGEAMVETQVTNASEGPAEIEVRLRRPTLNLQVGTQDFKIRVQE